jgi:multicomponent Na+:H+ antiporter subunit G
MTDALGGGLVAAGLLFYVAGSLGLLRLPDLYSRLHALTKADNLGLGLLTAGLVVHQGASYASLKLVLVWLLVLSASAASAHLIAQHARRRDRGPWKP